MPKLVEIDDCGECPHYLCYFCHHSKGKQDEVIPGNVKRPEWCPLPDAPSESQKAEVAQNCPKCWKHGEKHEYTDGYYQIYTCSGCKVTWPVRTK